MIESREVDTSLDLVDLIAWATLGLVIGSFLALIADRWPAGETILGRSRCGSCRRTLRPIELIPIISFVAQGGRCRDCRVSIPRSLLIAEIAGALIAWRAAAIGPTPAGALVLMLFGWTMLLLALLDWRALWLPDAITLPLVAVGLLASYLLPDPSLAERIAGAVLAFLAFEGLRLLYRRVRGHEGLGRGDAKLLAAIGAWLGLRPLPTIVLSAALLGLTFVALARLKGKAIATQDPLPFGTALASAALIWVGLLGYLDPAPTAVQSVATPTRPPGSSP